MMTHYAHRDIIGQGQRYIDHVQAMTAERLHDKGDIAAELAHRDERIAALEADLAKVRKALNTAEMDASVLSGMLKETEASLAVLKAERDAAVAGLNTVMNIPNMTDAQLEELKANCKAVIAARKEGPSP